MTMRGTSLKNAGYLLSLLPQALLVLGVDMQCPWLSMLLFFVALPILRYVIGNDLAQPVQAPSRKLTRYFEYIPRLYSLAWVLLLPWIIWILSTRPMTLSGYLGLTGSLWIVCSLNTAVAHELIHAAGNGDRKLGCWLDASVGYVHFFEEHLSHHARTGHYHGGDAAVPGTSIYRYAARRYRDSLTVAWRFEAARLRRMKLPWYANRLLRRLPVPFAIAAAFYVFAGGTGLGIYLCQIAGTAFTIQAITYLQHWGLSERETPEQRDFGFAWEDGCWMQACITLNHAYHGSHHLHPGRPFYRLAWAKDSLALPASYPVMLIAALFPAFFTRIMRRRLAQWTRNYGKHEEQWHQTDCIGLARIAPALRKPSSETPPVSPVDR